MRGSDTMSPRRYRRRCRPARRPDTRRDTGSDRGGVSAVTSGDGPPADACSTFDQRSHYRAQPDHVTTIGQVRQPNFCSRMPRSRHCAATARGWPFAICATTWPASVVRPSFGADAALQPVRRGFQLPSWNPQGSRAVIASIAREIGAGASTPWAEEGGGGRHAGLRRIAGLAPEQRPDRVPLAAISPAIGAGSGQFRERRQCGAADQCAGGRPAALVAHGSFVAFSSNARDSNYEIHTVDASTREVNRLTNDPANDVLPAISPDGRWVALPATVTKLEALRRVQQRRRTTPDCAPRRLARQLPLSMAWSGSTRARPEALTQPLPPL